MLANYHTHTWRCNHATGTEEEYVLNAIARGMKTLGFSDHTPYLFPNGYSSHFRMRPEQLSDYVQTVLGLRSRYAGQIDLPLGVEAEYYPLYFADTLRYLQDCGVEYMLLSMHFLNNELGEPYTGRPTEDENVLRAYCQQSVEAMETGLFSYFAHPDLINYTGDRAVYEKHIRPLCRKAKECGLPLELNILGLSTERHYPNPSFWTIAAEEGCSVLLGIDAHSAEAVADAQAEQQAVQFAASLGIQLLDSIPLRRI